jgi:hypothetical protein
MRNLAEVPATPPTPSGDTHNERGDRRWPADAVASSYRRHSSCTTTGACDSIIAVTAASDTGSDDIDMLRAARIGLRNCCGILGGTGFQFLELKLHGLRQWKASCAYVFTTRSGDDDIAIVAKDLLLGQLAPLVNSFLKGLTLANGSQFRIVGQPSGRSRAGCHATPSLCRCVCSAPACVLWTAPAFPVREMARARARMIARCYIWSVESANSVITSGQARHASAPAWSNQRQLGRIEQFGSDGLTMIWASATWRNTASTTPHRSPVHCAQRAR